MLSRHAQNRPSPVPVALLLIEVLMAFQFPDGCAVVEVWVKPGTAFGE
jgi:hypothetical protein